MDYTTNKNLAKPTENETYDLATVNENMDKIDAALKTNDDAITQLTEKMKYTKDINYESVTINSDGYGSVAVNVGSDEKIIGANIMTWDTGTLYGGPTIGNNGNGYGYILGKPNSVITNISIRWKVIKI